MMFLRAWFFLESHQVNALLTFLLLLMSRENLTEESARLKKDKKE